jgi:hypothetical protein
MRQMSKETQEHNLRLGLANVSHFHDTSYTSSDE